MRIAVISDIHGNLVALDAVLDDLSSDHYDELICLGDVATNGPRPRECLHRIRDIGCPVIMGNTDARLIGQEPPGVSDAKLKSPYFVIEAWCIEQLTNADLAHLHSFQATLEITVEEKSSILFFHGSPRHYEDYIAATTRDDTVSEMIGNASANLLVGGHTHVQLLRRINGKTVINVGTVGRPLLRVPLGPGDNRIVAPWAEYAMIEAEDGRLCVDLRRVPIDLAELERDAVKSGMPHAEWWLSEINRQGLPPHQNGGVGLGKLSYSHVDPPNSGDGFDA